jgi:hypothetical protein
MDRVRTVLGLVMGVFFVAGAFMHSTLGWKNISGQLVAAKAPADLFAGLALAWHLGGATMFTLGCIVLYVFVKFLRDRSSSLRVAQLIALFYLAFGIWALAESKLVFFVLTFAAPGLLLLVAATRSPGATPKTA